MLEKKQFPISPVLFKVMIGSFLLSLLFGNSYLSPAIMLVQKEGEEFLIKEVGGPANLDDGFFTKTAYAYDEHLSVDGSQIIEGDFEENNSEIQNYLIIINDDSFLGINSPVKFLLPDSQRYAIITYMVQEGDTPGKIAADFGINLNTILWANDLKFNSIIRPGQELIILPISGIRHIVAKGETLLSIAKKYKASTDEIFSFNNLKDEGSIQIGQELIIPNGQIFSAVSSASSGLGSGRLKPMIVDISHWPDLGKFFSYPTSGGWNKGIFHYYNAVDIINPCGSPIYAAADGIVVEAKGTGAHNYGYGNLVKIQHYNGTTTLYAHLNELSIKEGDKVSQGDLIGRMGNSGNADGCHLHFGVGGAQNPFVRKI